MRPLLAAHGLWVRLGGRWVLRGVDVEAYPGMVLGVIGPNGAGKTTLLKTLAGLTPASRGSITVLGKCIGEYDRRMYARLVALPLLSPAAGFRITVEEAFRITLRGLGLPYRRDAVIEVAEELGISGLMSRRLDTLSSGELQLVNIAIGLARRPRILLLDEPTSHLDIRRRIEVMEVLRCYARRSGASVVMAIHDLKLAADYSDHLIALRGGVVVASGGVDQVFRDEVLSETYSARIRVVRLEGLGLLPVVLHDGGGRGGEGC